MLRPVAPFLAVLLTAAGAAPVAADAFSKSAYELYQQCDTVTSRFLQGVCLGFIGASVSAGRESGVASADYCLPAEVTPALVRRQFMADIAADRIADGADAYAALVDSLSGRYPCDPEATPDRPVDPPAPEDLGLSAD